MGKYSLNEEIEIEFWRTSEVEGPTSDSLVNILRCAAEARIFLNKLEKFKHYFSGAEKIMELGGGQCWASAIVKRYFNHKTIIGSDISKYAVESAHKWERIFGYALDDKVDCKSYEIPVEDGSLDLVFAYAAAHHFARHEKTFIELKRVLKPGGVCLYLHEPCCGRLLHPLAKWRVNLKRPEVPEDVLVVPQLRRLATKHGLKMRYERDATLVNRKPFETIYYLVLNLLPFFAYLLPCSGDLIIHKPNEDSN